ncbi:MAG: antitoxin Xre-like helix-turn-helix domain-containing protein [Luteolibacter sp.]
MAGKFQGGDDTSERLRESASAYDTSLAIGNADGIDEGLAVMRNLGVKVSTKIAGALPRLRAALQNGLPRAAFEKLRTDLGTTHEELAEVLGIPLRTLARRTDRFKPDESERILRVASVYRKALNVLVEKDAAARWMTREKRALSGLTPLRCCDTEFGAREVDRLLTRIAHGVFT